MMASRTSGTQRGQSESVILGKPSCGAERSRLFRIFPGAHFGLGSSPSGSRVLTAWNARQAQSAIRDAADEPCQFPSKLFRPSFRKNWSVYIQILPSLACSPPRRRAGTQKCPDPSGASIQSDISYCVPRIQAPSRFLESFEPSRLVLRYNLKGSKSSKVLKRGAFRLLLVCPIAHEFMSQRTKSPSARNSSQAQYFTARSGFSTDASSEYFEDQDGFGKHQPHHRAVFPVLQYS